MKRYYYAGGRREKLQAEPKSLVIDASALTADSALMALLAKVRSAATLLPGGLLLVPRSALAEEEVESLAVGGALRPVYRHGRAVAVPMPEVRVEFDGDERQAALTAAAGAGVPFEVLEDTPDRLVMRPISRSGDEALDLANHIYESARPAASSVRMIQVVPKRVAGPR